MPRSSGVVEPYERRTHPNGMVHDLADFFRVRFAERAANYGKILAENENLSTINRSMSCDNTVGQVLVLSTEVAPSAGLKNIELLKRVFIEQ